LYQKRQLFGFAQPKAVCFNPQNPPRSTLLGLGTHLFVKVPRPGDNEVTFSVFESSCHL